MATSTNRLKGTIKTAFLAARNETNPENADAILDSLCQSIAEAVVNEITSASIAHIISLTSPSGPVTGTINSTIS